VHDPLFAGSGFFDPRDLVQVRYEMLRPIPAVPPVLAPVDKAPIAALLGSMLVHCLGAVL
jgi:hypothetical protein